MGDVARVPTRRETPQALVDQLGRLHVEAAAGGALPWAVCIAGVTLAGGSVRSGNLGLHDEPLLDRLAEATERPRLLVNDAEGSGRWGGGGRNARARPDRLRPRRAHRPRRRGRVRRQRARRRGRPRRLFPGGAAAAAAAPAASRPTPGSPRCGAVRGARPAGALRPAASCSTRPRTQTPRPRSTTPSPRSRSPPPCSSAPPTPGRCDSAAESRPSGARRCGARCRRVSRGCCSRSWRRARASSCQSCGSERRSSACCSSPA